MQNYAPPERRSTEQEIHEELDFVNMHPLVSQVLDSVTGILAVLDERRHIISMNHGLMACFGLNNFQNLTEMRPGEAFHCVHAQESPEGCGTSEFCSTCGLAISILLSQRSHGADERKCALRVQENDKEKDLVFRIRSIPLDIEDNNFTMIFMQDISQLQMRESIQQTFFHDLNNILTSLVGLSDLLKIVPQNQQRGLIFSLSHVVESLKDEVELQRTLSNDINFQSLKIKEIHLRTFLEDMASLAAKLPEAKDIPVKLKKTPGKHVTFCSSYNLLGRVVLNMLKNAVEASHRGEEVTLSAVASSTEVVISVHNASVIEEEIQKRIFQRYFSTKEGENRGLGTYSIKLFGEKFLKGRVYFKSLEGEGTTFRITLPQRI